MNAKRRTELRASAFDELAAWIENGIETDAFKDRLAMNADEDAVFFDVARSTALLLKQRAGIERGHLKTYDLP